MESAADLIYKGGSYVRQTLRKEAVAETIGDHPGLRVVARLEAWYGLYGEGLRRVGTTRLWGSQFGKGRRWASDGSAWSAAMEAAAGDDVPALGAMRMLAWPGEVQEYLVPMLFMIGEVQAADAAGRPDLGGKAREALAHLPRGWAEEAPALFDYAVAVMQDFMAIVPGDDDDAQPFLTACGWWDWEPTPAAPDDEIVIKMRHTPDTPEG